MDIGTISRRYATALFRYARKQEQEKCIYEETIRLAAALRHYPPLRRLLANPILETDKKEKAICLATNDEVSKEFQNFIRLIIRQKRESVLDLICLGYQNIYRLETNLLHVDIIAAIPLTKATQKLLITKMERQTQKKVDIYVTVEPRIMGGYLIYWDTFRWDASTRSRLHRLRDDLKSHLKIN